MALFESRKIREGVYCILDKDEDSFYLIEGDRFAAVIDTGITEGEKIVPVLRQHTDKPLVLILTHAHIDHMHHMDEFDTVYMCHDELTMPRDWLISHMAGKELDLEATIHIDTGSKIDLGGRVLEIFKVPGHTPGSVAVYDAKEDIVFTGDAIGSGCGVWMQLIGCTSLVEYENSLRQFLLWLLEHGGKMEFWSGHCTQYSQSKKIPEYNPVSVGLLADLIDLVRKVIDGDIVGDVIDLPPHVRVREARYAAYGRAEMLYNPDNVRLCNE